jgi:hypothetical protein
MAAQSSPRPIADRETFLNAGKHEASSPAVSLTAKRGADSWIRSGSVTRH